MPTPPIIVYKPRVTVQNVTDAGVVVTGALEIDLTDDFQTMEIGVSIPTDTVSTFAAKYQIVDAAEPSAAGTVVINSGTSARWGPLVGLRLRMRVWDRTDSTVYRQIITQLQINPALYGGTEPGNARAVDIDFPVLDGPTSGTGAPPA